MPADAKQFIGAIAMIRRDGTGGRDEWLVLWNAGRGCYQFIEAHRIEEESYRESLIREIAWTTGLRTGKDYLVAGGPRAHLQFAESQDCHSDPIWFIVEFFLVELMGKQHREILDDHADACWITTEDLQNGRAPDSRPLCPRLLSLLKQADILMPWQGGSG